MELPMVRPTRAALLSLILALAGPAAAQTTPPSTPTTPGAPENPAGVIGDAMFVQRLKETNEFEIESSRLAMERATTGAVKNFAQKIIVDHTRAGEKLQAILDDPKWKVPETPVKPSERNAAYSKMLEDLGALTDPSFDRRYVAAQTQVHEEAVQMVRDYVARGADPTLKAFAAELLPDLEAHLEAIKRVPLPA
jgi:putative membrane protein